MLSIVGQFVAGTKITSKGVIAGRAPGRDLQSASQSGIIDIASVGAICLILHL